MKVGKDQREAEAVIRWGSLSNSCLLTCNFKKKMRKIKNALKLFGMSKLKKIINMLSKIVRKLPSDKANEIYQNNISKSISNQKIYKEENQIKIIWNNEKIRFFYMIK